jgi:hypothetical protein
LLARNELPGAHGVRPVLRPATFVLGKVDDPFQRFSSTVSKLGVLRQDARRDRGFIRENHDDWDRAERRYSTSPARHRWGAVPVCTSIRYREDRVRADRTTPQQHHPPRWLLASCPPPSAFDATGVRLRRGAVHGRAVKQSSNEGRPDIAPSCCRARTLG